MEMLRVGREGVVSFPNFGYWKHRAPTSSPAACRCPTDCPSSGTTRRTSIFTIADFESSVPVATSHPRAQGVMTEGRR
jgi:hypothetical protein